MKDISQIPTPLLQQKYEDEKARVFSYLMKAYPISEESLEMLIADLKAMNEELDRRRKKENGE